MIKCIDVTTNIGCRNKCNYCPQDKLIARYSKRSNSRLLSFHTFKKCIDKIPRKVIVQFAGFSDPWLNPNCTKMMLYAHKRGFRIITYTTCKSISDSDIASIKRIPFLGFYVHLLPRQLNKHDFKRMQKLITSKIKNVKFVLLRSRNAPVNIPAKLENLINRSKVPLLIWLLNSRAGNVNPKIGLPLKKKSGTLKCDRLYQNVLLPNGDVNLCCMDWNLNHILGNLLSSNYKSLFKSKEFLKINAGLKNTTSNIICRYCEYATKKGGVK